MEKAKAIAHVKDMYEYMIFREDKEALETLIPELTESEEERIRKYLIEELKAAKSIGELKFTIPQPTREECIAYLEKQKESPKKELGKYSEEEELAYRLNWVMQDYYKAGKDEEEREHRFKCYHLFWNALEDSEFFNRLESHKEELTKLQEKCKKFIEKQKEQKPAEWSEEDEEKINNISEIIEHCIAIPYSGGTLKLSQEYKKELQCFLKSLRPQSKREWSEEDEKKIVELKNFIAQCNGFNKENRKKAFDMIDALRYQPKQEWSEKDEDMLNSCISSIEEAKENRYAYKETDGDTSYDHEIDWLKSLRPSWKPSEER